MINLHILPLPGFFESILMFLNSFTWGLPTVDESITFEKRPNQKLDSVSYKDLIEFWVTSMYPGQNVIALTNINLHAKNIQFWAKVPKEEVPHFMKDVAIVLCKDVRQMETLISNIGTDFADASAFSEGKLLFTNKDFR